MLRFKMRWAGSTTTFMNSEWCRVSGVAPCTSAFRTTKIGRGNGRSCLAGREIPILRYLSAKGAQAAYTYDFGDGWKHTVVVEDVLPRVPGAIYPRCVGGRRKCPPEDVGGVWGYERFLSALADPTHEEHESYLIWVGGSYDPEGFDADSVRFDDPEKRWRIAFLDEDEDEA